MTPRSRDQINAETIAALRQSGRRWSKFSKAQQWAWASAGGKAAHATGRAHTFTKEQAREAGRLGGLASAAKKRVVKESA